MELKKKKILGSLLEKVGAPGDYFCIDASQNPGSELLDARYYMADVQTMINLMSVLHFAIHMDDWICTSCKDRVYSSAYPGFRWEQHVTTWNLTLALILSAPVVDALTGTWCCG